MNNNQITRTYWSLKRMDADISVMKGQGYKVASEIHIKGGYSGKKGCCLFCLFPPLALLGFKKDKWVVRYEK